MIFGLDVLEDFISLDDIRYGSRIQYCVGIAHFETELWVGHISYPVQLSYELAILTSFFTC